MCYKILFYALLLISVSCDAPTENTQQSIVPKAKDVPRNEPQTEIKSDGPDIKKLNKFLEKWSKVELKEFEDFFTSVKVVQPNQVIFQLNQQFSQYDTEAQEKETIPIMKIHMKDALGKQNLPITWVDEVEITFRKK